MKRKIPKELEEMLRTKPRDTRRNITMPVIGLKPYRPIQPPDRPIYTPPVEKPYRGPIGLLKKIIGYKG